MVHRSGQSLVIKTHAQKRTLRKKAEVSALQKGDDDPPDDGISFELHDEGTNQQTRLVTQRLCCTFVFVFFAGPCKDRGSCYIVAFRFNGRERDTRSCLAFAPKSKSGAQGQATEADWQAGQGMMAWPRAQGPRPRAQGLCGLSASQRLASAGPEGGRLFGAGALGRALWNRVDEEELGQVARRGELSAFRS